MAGIMFLIEGTSVFALLDQLETRIDELLMQGC